MWWDGDSALDVYVGTRAVAACGGDARVVAEAVTDFEGAVTVLREWSAEGSKRQCVRVWLSGGLCRPFLVQPVPGVKGEGEVRMLVSAMAPRHTGLSGDCTVWIDDGKRSEPRVAAALQKHELERLLQVLQAAGSGGHRVVSIRPWWAEAHRWALGQGIVHAMAVHDCDSLTVLAGRDGRFELATTFTPVVDAETADAALARATLTLDVAMEHRRKARLMPLGEARAEAPAGLALSRWVEWAG